MKKKRLILLTQKGRELISQMQPVWNIMITVLNEITENQNHLLKAITEVEAKIANQSFLQRALQLKKEEENKHSTS